MDVLRTLCAQLFSQGSERLYIARFDDRIYVGLAPATAIRGEPGKKPTNHEILSVGDLDNLAEDLGFDNPPNS